MRRKIHPEAVLEIMACMEDCQTEDEPSKHSYEA